MSMTEFNTPKALHSLVMATLWKRAITWYPPWSDLLLPDVAEVPVCDDSLPVLDRSRSWVSSLRQLGCLYKEIKKTKQNICPAKWRPLWTHAAPSRTITYWYFIMLALLVGACVHLVSQTIWKLQTWRYFGSKYFSKHQLGLRTFSYIISSPPPLLVTQFNKSFKTRPFFRTFLPY